MEQTYGIPTAPISTYGFENLAKDAYKTGRVPLPFVFTPHPVAGMSIESLYGYIEGKDPETGTRVIDEIIDEEEVVVKKLDPLLPSTIYSGSSVYADGQPILIIDPRGFE